MADNDCLDFWVDGTPVPKGDQKTNPKTGHHYWANDKQLKEWTQNVAGQALAEVMRQGRGKPWTDGWVEVMMQFRLRRPKSNRDPYPKRPDGDKLDRAVLDALTGIVYADDGMVPVHYTFKYWADRAHSPGVHIMVWRL